MKTIEAEATTPATRDEVWSLLEDAASWALVLRAAVRDSCKRLARAASARQSGYS